MTPMSKIIAGLVFIFFCASATIVLILASMDKSGC